jgi:hypothetical protein
MGAIVVVICPFIPILATAPEKSLEKVLLTDFVCAGPSDPLQLDAQPRGTAAVLATEVTEAPLRLVVSLVACGAAPRTTKAAGWPVGL